MNSSRPYLVRALYEWIVDNDCTPHMLVNSEYPSVQVPQGFASDGQIVLNVSPQAVRHLHMDNEAVSFEGRFGGVLPAVMSRGAVKRPRSRDGPAPRRSSSGPCLR